MIFEYTASNNRTHPPTPNNQIVPFPLISPRHTAHLTHPSHKRSARHPHPAPWGRTITVRNAPRHVDKCAVAYTEGGDGVGGDEVEDDK